MDVLRRGSEPFSKTAFVSRINFQNKDFFHRGTKSGNENDAPDCTLLLQTKYNFILSTFKFLSF
jgi:hypothetical protein